VESGSVFGCIIMSPVQPAAQDQGSINGSFCFKLDGKNAIFYPEAGSTHDIDTRDMKRTNPSAESFTKFTENEIVIGDSESKTICSTPHAIKFVNDLRMCHVGSSDTYLNAPLADESSPCAAECVEIFCGPWNIELQALDGKLSRPKIEI